MCVFAVSHSRHICRFKVCLRSLTREGPTTAGDFLFLWVCVANTFEHHDSFGTRTVERGVEIGAETRGGDDGSTS